MKQSLSFLLLFFFAQHATSQSNQVPVITNLKAEIKSNLNLEISFDLSDAENDALEIIAQVSTDAGYSFFATNTLPAPSGDIGYPISAGTNKKIVFQNASGLIGNPISIRVTALDRQPIDMAFIVSQIDSNALKNRLGFVEGVRHRTAGAAHLLAVQDSIMDLFQQLNIGLKEQPVPFANYTGRNLIGNKQGFERLGQTVIVDAHYDSVSNSPGADDNGSGTVAVMEIAELLSKYPSKKGLRFIGFDLEETGLNGSSAYVNSLAASDTVIGVLNFEMIGFYTTQALTQTLPNGFNLLFPAAYNAVIQDSSRGNFITNVGNAASQGLVNRFRTAAQTYVPALRVIDVVTPGTGSITPDLLRSDHAPFWLSGREALMITDGANFRNTNYHTLNDSLYKLNFKFMQQVTQASVVVAAELAEVQHGSWLTTNQVDIEVGTTDTQDKSCQCSVHKTDGILSLSLHGCPNAAIGELISIDGKLLARKLLQSTHLQAQIIEAPITASGMYFLRIIDHQGQIVVALKI
jgi:Zn-dependent M28 family amino/carboxypeptidase